MASLERQTGTQGKVNEEAMKPPAHNQTSQDRIAWYRQMATIRSFEDKVQELFMAGLIAGSTHLCQGQEAVSVGAISAMDPGDVFTNTYRGHGQALARGMAPSAALAEIMGRSSGSCRGVGGSMHLADLSSGNLGANAIVGGGLPIAVGAAMAFKLRSETRAALSFCGDGATNIGTFHEALNMAAVWRAPVIFIVENNLYGEYSPLRETTAVRDLAVRATAYGIPGQIIDGQDVEAVFLAVSGALRYARDGQGPTLLEMKTYRYRGHSRSDPAKYRPEGELDEWKARDPIEILGARICGEGRVSAADLEQIRREIQIEIDAAAEDAAAAPPPTLEEAAHYVYADA